MKSMKGLLLMLTCFAFALGGSCCSTSPPSEKHSCAEPPGKSDFCIIEKMNCQPENIMLITTLDEHSVLCIVSMKKNGDQVQVTHLNFEKNALVASGPYTPTVILLHSRDYGDYSKSYLAYMNKKDRYGSRLCTCQRMC